jgi:hypothetical protein
LCICYFSVEKPGERIVPFCFDSSDTSGVQTSNKWVPAQIQKRHDSVLERFKNSDTMDWWLKDKSDRVSV